MCQKHAANHRAELVNVAHGINLVFGTMVLFWSNVLNLCKGVDQHSTQNQIGVFIFKKEFN